MPTVRDILRTYQPQGYNNDREKTAYLLSDDNIPLPPGLIITPDRKLKVATQPRLNKLQNLLNINNRYYDSFTADVNAVYQKYQNIPNAAILIPKLANIDLQLSGGWIVYYRVKYVINYDEQTFENIADWQPRYGPYETVRSVNYPNIGSKDWYKPHQWSLELDSLVATSIFNHHDMEGILVFVPSLIAPKQRREILQKYKHGSLNCVIGPIINKLEHTISNSNNKKYKTRLQNIIDNLNTVPVQDGLSIEDIKAIFKKVPVHIIIKDPFQEEDANIKHSRPIISITYINTYFDHVEHCVETTPVYISDNEFKKIKINVGDLYTTSTIFKPTITYKKQSTLDYKNFMKTNNIDYITDKTMQDYVELAAHHSGTIIYNNNIIPTTHIDKINAYATYDTNQFYQTHKFPATRPQIFMQLQPDHDFVKYPGFYHIDQFDLSDVHPNIVKHLLILNYGWRDEYFTSPELDYYRSIGIKFKILDGAYCFDRRDITIDPATIPSQSYKKYIGMLSHRSNTVSYKVKSDQKLIEILSAKYELNYHRDPDGDYTITRDIVKNRGSRTSTHIAAYILSYARISSLQQLFIINADDVHSITNDDIHYRNTYEILPGFRDKKISTKFNESYGSFISHKSYLIPAPEFNPIFLNKYVLFTGAPGTGKSHKLINSPQLIDKLYVSDADKLNQCYHNHETLQRLTATDKSVQKSTKDLSVLIADECYKYNDLQISLLQQRNQYSAIYWCGDPCQLPPIIRQSPIDKNYIKYNDMTQVHLTENHRIQCEYLQTILTNIRIQLERKQDDPKHNIRNLNNVVYQYLAKSIETITYDRITDDDVIITSTHDNIKEITTNLQHLKPKYYVNKRYNNILAGSVIDHEIPGHTTLQHAFTVHSYQGATIYNPKKLIIDFRNLFESNMLYVILSRVNKLSQIYLLSTAPVCTSAASVRAV